MMSPKVRRLLSSLPLISFASFVFAQNSPAAGPSVTFSRQGPEVCAAYTIDASRPVYRDRIYAFDSGVRIPIQGLPVGKSKTVAGERVTLLESSFKSCTRALSPSAPVSWIDQSCYPVQGVCLPPRGFEIDASGRARALPPQSAAALFSRGFTPLAPGLNEDGWTFKLDPKR